MDVAAEAPGDAAVRIWIAAAALPRKLPAQCFTSDDGLARAPAPFNGTIESKIPARPSRRDHPMEDVVPVFTDGGFIASADANVGHGNQCDVPGAW